MSNAHGEHTQLGIAIVRERNHGLSGEIQASWYSNAPLNVGHGENEIVESATGHHFSQSRQAPLSNSDANQDS